MEEILASIRRIISEDEVPAEAGVVVPELEPEPEPEDVFEVEPETYDEPVMEIEEDVLDLTEPYEAPQPEPVFQSEDIEAYVPAARPAPMPQPVVQEAIVSDIAEAAAASAFGHLAQTIAMPGHGRTLEDVVRELLRPLLKTWLDENLPTIVQATVDEEVARISRRRL